MKLINKLSATALAVGIGFATSASAGEQIDVDFYKTDGTQIFDGITATDWHESGSGVAVGKGPFGSDPTQDPNPFDFYYQSYLSAITGGAGSGLVDGIGNWRGVGGSNLVNFDAGGDVFEITIVASILELASLTGPTSADFTPQSGTVSLFYDSGTAGGTEFNVATGSGFADGIEIARFSIVSGDSNFSITGPDQGAGGTSFNFEIVATLDFVNPDYLIGIAEQLVFDFHFDSNQNYPPGTSETTNFFAGSSVPGVYAPYAVTGDDLVLKVDGSSTYTAVPEPNIMLLLSGALLALGYTNWRYKNSRT